MKVECGVSRIAHIKFKSNRERVTQFCSWDSAVFFHDYTSMEDELISPVFCPGCLSTALLCWLLRCWCCCCCCLRYCCCCCWWCREEGGAGRGWKLPWTEPNAGGLDGRKLELGSIGETEDGLLAEEDEVWKNRERLSEYQLRTFPGPTSSRLHSLDYFCLQFITFWTYGATGLFTLTFVP